MNAVIIDLDKFRRTAPHVELVANTLSFRNRIKETMAQSIMEDYRDWPWPVVEQAIIAAGNRLDAGGTFLDALEASEHIFLDNPRPIDRERRKLLLQGRHRRREAFFKVAAREIEHRLQGNKAWLQKHYALVRARRVIEGGGTIGAALRIALGDGYVGGVA